MCILAAFGCVPRLCLSTELAGPCDQMRMTEQYSEDSCSSSASPSPNALFQKLVPLSSRRLHLKQGRMNARSLRLQLR